MLFVSSTKIIIYNYVYIALCLPNTYSDTGMEPCIQCPPTHYQIEYGSSECSFCTNETSFLDECIITEETTKSQFIY